MRCALIVTYVLDAALLLLLLLVNSESTAVVVIKVKDDDLEGRVSDAELSWGDFPHTAVALGCGSREARGSRTGWLAGTSTTTDQMQCTGQRRYGTSVDVGY
jgi:hypothetical protein